MEESVNELKEMIKKEKTSPSTEGEIKIMSSDLEKFIGVYENSMCIDSIRITSFEQMAIQNQDNIIA
jgi:hypothetical protein